MTLEERAKAAAEELHDKIFGVLDHKDRSGPDHGLIANALVWFAREFAAEALRSIYHVDDNDQTGSDGERSRGSWYVDPTYAGMPTIEKRWYRKEFEETLSQIIDAAAIGGK